MTFSFLLHIIPPYNLPQVLSLFRGNGLRSNKEAKENCLCWADNMFILLHVRVTLSSYNVLFISRHKHLRTMQSVEKGLQVDLLETSGEDYSCQQKIYSVFSLVYLENLLLKIKAMLSQILILYGKTLAMVRNIKQMTVIWAMCRTSFASRFV